MIVGTGLDLAEISRFDFSTAKGDWFRRRIFTEIEAAYAEGKRHPAQHYAGAFAAKEAFRKAYGGSVPWLEVGVTHGVNGAPQFSLAPKLQAELKRREIAAIHLSITHTRDHAAAVVIFERLIQGDNNQ